MNQKEIYQPEWISAEHAAQWLGVDITTLWRWRTTQGIAWSKINGKTLMYDKKQLNKILNENSTYAVLGEKKLAS